MRLSPEFVLDSIKDNLGLADSRLYVNNQQVIEVAVSNEAVTLKLKDGTLVKVTSSP